MALSNILIPNNYDLYAESIKLGDSNPFDTFYETLDITFIMTYEDNSEGNITCKLTRIGSVVHLYVPYNTKTLGSVVHANRYISMQIPEKYQPLSGDSSDPNDWQYQPTFCSVGSTYQYGSFDVKNNGTVDFFSNTNRTTKPGNGSIVTFYPQVYTWYIA